MPLYKLPRSFHTNEGVEYRRGEIVELPEEVPPPRGSILIAPSDEEPGPEPEPELDLLPLASKETKK